MSTTQVIAHLVAVKHAIDATATTKKNWTCRCAACLFMKTDTILREAVIREAKSKGYDVKEVDNEPIPCPSLSV